MIDYEYQKLFKKMTKKRFFSQLDFIEKIIKLRLVRTDFYSDQAIEHDIKTLYQIREDRQRLENSKITLSDIENYF